MKRIIAVLVIVLMFSLPLVVADLPVLAGGSTSGAPSPTAGTINLGNGRIPKGQVFNFFNLGGRSECSTGAKSNCWEVTGETLKVYDPVAKGKKGNGKEVDINTLYLQNVGIDSNGNLKGETNMLISPDGRVLVGAASDSTIHQWILDKEGKYKDLGVFTGTVNGPITSVGTGDTRLPIIPLTGDKVSVGGISMPKEVYDNQVKNAVQSTGGTVDAQTKTITLPSQKDQTPETIKIEAKENGDSMVTHTPSVPSGQTATPRTVYTIGGVEIVQEGDRKTYDGKPYVGDINFGTGTATLHGTEGGTLEIKPQSDGKRIVTTCEATDKCEGNPRVERVVDDKGNAVVKTFDTYVTIPSSIVGQDRNGNLLWNGLMNERGELLEKNGYSYVGANGKPLPSSDPGYGKPWNRRTTEISYEGCNSNTGECSKTARYDPQTGQITGDVGAKATLEWIREQEAFRFGETEGQRAFRGAFVEQRFNFRGTAALFGWDSYGEWAQNVEKFFAANILGIEPASSFICDKFGYGLEDVPENIGVIETQSGTYQTVAHIEAEVSPGGFHPCSEEGTCPAELECHDDGFCYKMGEDKPKETFFYKITWGVTAPRDEKFTPRIDEDKQAVTFNIQLKNAQQSIYLFKNLETNVADASSLELDNGQKSSQFWNELIAEYSLYRFDKACIVWGLNKPKTLDLGCFGNPFTEECLKDIGEKCIGIADAKPSSTNDARDEIGLAQSTEERPGVYCGLNGC